MLKEKSLTSQIQLFLVIKPKRIENYAALNLNGLLVARQTDYTSPVGCAMREISSWLSQDIRTWTHRHQTFQQRRSENQRGHPSP